MLTLMLVDKAESSIWKFNVNGIKKYLHSGFYFNFENTLLLPDIKYFWINHIRNRSNFWGRVIYWTMWPELFYLYCYVKHISFPWGGHWSENVICNSAWIYFPVVFFHLMVFPTFRTLVHWPLILLNTSTKMFIHHKIKRLLLPIQCLEEFGANFESLEKTFTKESIQKIVWYCTLLKCINIPKEEFPTLF